MILLHYSIIYLGSVFFEEDVPKCQQCSVGFTIRTRELEGAGWCPNSVQLNHKFSPIPTNHYRQKISVSYLRRLFITISISYENYSEPFRRLALYPIELRAQIFIRLRGSFSISLGTKSCLYSRRLRRLMLYPTVPHISLLSLRDPAFGRLNN